MKILSASQFKNVDEETIHDEAITSMVLMERAAAACVKRITGLCDKATRFSVICGMGNNGGDGLAITRMLLENGYECRAFVIHHGSKFSHDAEKNLEHLRSKDPSACIEVHKIEDLVTGEQDTVIDALFGTGINKPVEGLAEEVISLINKKQCRVISIDVPSGLPLDTTLRGTAIHSWITLTFQSPKLAFLLPQNSMFVPEFEILDIGLSHSSVVKQPTNHFYITSQDISALLLPRNKFSHKGSFGKGLLLAGSHGKSGAAIIAAKSCLRSGAGLLTVHSTNETLSALLHHLPEAMTSIDHDEKKITEIEKPGDFDAIAIGPGIGTDPDTQQALKKLLNYYAGDLVIDADALNILSENKTWLNFLPPACILTPHPKEFERLTGKCTDDYERLSILKQFSMKHNCIVILKGAHSCIAMPDGNLFFNGSGNPGLAKGGSGDALTGIILGLLCRGYTPPKAALIGTFIHGYAADLCTLKSSMESLLITDVIDRLPEAFRNLEH